MDTRQFIVGEGDRGNRIDRWLGQKMPDFSRGQIKHLIDQGKVLINHRRVLIAGWELESQDAVEVRIPDQGVPEAREEIRPPRAGAASPERSNLPMKSREIAAAPSGPRNDKRSIPRNDNKRGQQDDRRVSSGRRFLDVVFEDKDLIVVNKPYGVLSEPKGDSPHDHLLGMIRGYLKRKFKESRGSYVKLLHRLDKDTSGVLVAAKSKVGEQLESQFRGHRVERHYVAIVEGRLEQEEGKIDLPLEKGDFEGGRKVKVAGKGEGAPAITRFRVKERYENATLLDVSVETGRTHQVRVHFAQMGHPLVGDKIYGAVKIPFPRHALHASMLGFSHPRTKKFERYEAKLPKDMEGLIDKLRGG
ncbi:MAG: RluA family pseudouridine synthase [Deltaproteobacteria bacterium]|nr:RluA family pseudouridine synthase [Deltaproteobacteria bacterium]